MRSSFRGSRRGRRVAVVALIVVVATLGAPGSVAAASPFGPAPRAVERTLRGPSSLPPGAERTRTFVLPIRANLIAFSWRAADPEAAGVSLQVRARTRSGWAPWTPVPVNDDEGPDAAELRETRVFTEPLWVGSADRLRVSLRAGRDAASLRDVRVHLINTKGDAIDPGLAARALRALGRFLNGTPAAAMTTTPRIITRWQWGADERIRGQDPPRTTSTIQLAFVHHTAGTNSYARSESDDVVRAIYRYHVRTRDFRDIGYSFLVDRYGQVFEGRWGGIDKAVVGAHVKGFNSGSTGVALMGTFTSANPPAGMIRSLERLLAWKLDVHHVSPVGTAAVVSGGSDKYRRGQTVRLNRISGHRDAQLTSCPGARTYRLLPAIRSAVNGIGNPKIFLPSPPAEVLRPDGDGVADALNVRATFTATLAWTLTVTAPDGRVVRTWTGAGRSMSVWWNGTALEGPTLVPTGTYQWRLSARDAGGGVAREAMGPLLVVTDHPNGTVLDDGSRRVVVEAGGARPIDAVAWQSRYPTGDVVRTGPSEIDRLAGLGPAAPVPIRDGTLLRQSSNGAYFVVTGGVARPVDASVFAALGYAAEAAIPVPDAYLASLAQGPAVTDTTTHPEGSAVRDPTGAVWLIEAGVRRPLPAAALASRYRGVEVVGALPGDLSLPPGDVAPVRDGTLLLLSDGTRWIVSDGVRRRFAGAGIFDAMGYSTAWMLRPADADVAGITTGPQIG